MDSPLGTVSLLTAQKSLLWQYWLIICLPAPLLIKTRILSSLGLLGSELLNMNMHVLVIV